MFLPHDCISSRFPAMRTSLIASLLVLSCVNCLSATDSQDRPSRLQEAQYRGPSDVVLLAGGAFAVTANELSDSLSLVDLTRQSVVDEIACGMKPSTLAVIGDQEVLVACRASGSVERFAISDGRLQRVAQFDIGFDPVGLAVDTPRQRGFVGLVASGEIVELNLTENTLGRRFPSGNWPRSLAVSPDGSRLAVGLSGDSSIAVHALPDGEQLYAEPISGGINIGHMQCSPDGTYVYFPWMVYRSNPITVSNIQRGWVLASRIARVRLDGPSYREAISLDVPRKAVADPYGLTLLPDESRLVVSSSGTHELLVYRLPDVPWIAAGGPGDLIDRKLLADDDLFFRIETGGRPLNLQATADNRHVIVANYTLDRLQTVDLQERRIVGEIALGHTPTDSAQQLWHRGLELFHDAGRSLDQWYSCNSCHLDGGSNAKPMDTWNDGTELTSKTVLPLQGVTETGPWTWHGWQGDLRESLQNSFTSTMQGPSVSEADLTALHAYLSQLDYPPNPFRGQDGSLTAAAKRGQALFESSDVGCAQCHSGPRFTDGEIHDVGIGSESDYYQGYNTPSLLGLYRKVRFLHDGRARSLETVLTKYHRPEDIGGGASLNEEQLADLIAYLRSL